MSFLTALLDQQAAKSSSQPELPESSSTKTAFRLPASKSLPALKPSASSSSLQVVNIEVPSSDLNMVRVCNEKVPEPRDGPFEQTLDNWLRLFFLPAAKNAAERRKKMA